MVPWHHRRLSRCMASPCIRKRPPKSALFARGSILVCPHSTAHRDQSPRDSEVFAATTREPATPPLDRDLTPVALTSDYIPMFTMIKNGGVELCEVLIRPGKRGMQFCNPISAPPRTQFQSEAGTCCLHRTGRGQRQHSAGGVEQSVPNCCDGDTEDMSPRRSRAVAALLGGETVVSTRAPAEWFGALSPPRQRR